MSKHKSTPKHTPADVEAATKQIEAELEAASAAMEAMEAAATAAEASKSEAPTPGPVKAPKPPKPTPNEHHKAIAATVVETEDGVAVLAGSADKRFAQHAAALAIGDRIADIAAEGERFQWAKLQRKLAAQSLPEGRKLEGSMSKRVTQALRCVARDSALAMRWAQGDFSESLSAAYTRLFAAKPSGETGEAGEGEGDNPKGGNPNYPALDKVVAAVLAGKYTVEDIGRAVVKARATATRKAA